LPFEVANARLSLLGGFLFREQPISLLTRLLY
jgi:hypothetical protein